MMIETMNEGDCLKLHGKIDADDNARMRFQEVVAPEIEVPLFKGIVWDRYQSPWIHFFHLTPSTLLYKKSHTMVAQIG